MKKQKIDKLKQYYHYVYKYMYYVKCKMFKSDIIMRVRTFLLVYSTNYKKYC